MAAPHIAGAVALCLGEAGAAGPCADLSPASIIARIRDIAAGQSPGYGFVGDPLRPAAGRYFGYLAWAGLAPAEVPEPVPVPTDPPAGGSAPPSPAPAAAPPAPVPPSPPATDSTAPTATLSVRRQRLRTVLRRGLAAALRCSEGCVASAEVWLPGRTAKRLRLSRGARVRIARRLRVQLAANTRKGIALKLSRRARAKLAGVRRVTLLVKLTVTDPAGNRRTATRKVTLRR